jgi:hypothetical protein
MKLNKRIEEKLKCLGGMFVTDNVYNNEQLEDRKAKYWLLWHHTYKVVAGCRTQKDLEEIIDDIRLGGKGITY